MSSGGPAPEALTDAMFARTKVISVVKSCDGLPDVDLSRIGVHTFPPTLAGGGGHPFTVEVIDPVDDYAALLATNFDFPALRALVARPDFSVAYDGLSGVAGAYATRILGGLLGVPAASLHNCVPLPDFGGHHPDPNLTYASELVARMGLTSDGSPAAGSGPVPDFGAAQDGDADRNRTVVRSLGRVVA